MLRCEGTMDEATDNLIVSARARAHRWEADRQAALSAALDTGRFGMMREMLEDEQTAALIRALADECERRGRIVDLLSAPPMTAAETEAELQAIVPGSSPPLSEEQIRNIIAAATDPGRMDPLMALGQLAEAARNALGDIRPRSPARRPLEEALERAKHVTQ
jgi:hypothetical protein